MIYDTSSVDSLLICKNCEANIDIPKSLSWGKVICSYCETYIHVNDNKFECSLCIKIHEMPKDGLSICKPLLQMISVKPTKQSRGKTFDMLENLLKVVEKNRSLIKHGIIEQ